MPRLPQFVFASTLAFVPLMVGTPTASADDRVPPAPAVKPAASSTTIVFGDGVARFNVVRDPSGRAVLFRLADPNVRITSAPVVIVKSDRGEEQIPLVAVDGSTTTWRLAHPRVVSGRFAGTMRVVVADKPYTTELVLDAPVRIAPRHGGFIIPLEACSAHVEVVHDLGSGTLTVYGPPDVKIDGLPEIRITETSGPAAEVVVTPMEGRPGVWRVSHPTFKTVRYSGTIRLMVGGKPCEAPLTFSAPHGGTLVTVEGGPRFEVVSQPEGGGYTVYALDETIDGKPYVIEKPEFVYTTPEGPRTIQMVPIESEPRAWRVVGLDGGVSAPGDARLRFSLFGRSLEGRIGLSGIGLDAR